MTAPQSEEDTPTLAVVLAALVALLIAGATVAAVIAVLMRLGQMSVEALRYLLRPTGPVGAAIRVPRPNTGTWREPQYQQYNQNIRRRAAYLVNAGKRMTRAYESGGLEGLQRAYEAEARYFAQHLQAVERRDRAAAEVAAAMEISQVRLGWYATLDERTSGECRQAHGRNFDPTRIPPIGFPGSVHPHCFPAGTVASGPPVELGWQRWYSGDLVEIRTQGGRVVAGTPNHPILTEQGWVPLGSLDATAHVLCSAAPEGLTAPRVGPDEHQQPARIEDLASPARMPLGVPSVRVPMAPEHFHGDGSHGEVDVVDPLGLLRDHFQGAQPLGEELLMWGAHDRAFLALLGEALQALTRDRHPLAPGAARHRARQVLLGSLVGGNDPVRVGPAADLDSLLSQDAADGGPGYEFPLRESLNAHAGPVIRDELVEVRRFPFAGHVYNLQTADGWYISNGILAHNCRCRAGVPFATSKRVETIRPDHGAWRAA